MADHPFRFRPPLLGPVHPEQVDVPVLLETFLEELVQVGRARKAHRRAQREARPAVRAGCERQVRDQMARLQEDTLPVRHAGSSVMYPQWSNTALSYWQEHNYECKNKTIHTVECLLKQDNSYGWMSYARDDE